MSARSPRRGEEWTDAAGRLLTCLDDEPNPNGYYVMRDPDGYYTMRVAVDMTPPPEPPPAWLADLVVNVKDDGGAQWVCGPGSGSMDIIGTCRLDLSTWEPA